MRDEDLRSDDKRLPEPEFIEPLKVSSSERIYDSPWVGLRRDWLELGDGERQEHHVIEITDAVVVLPIRSDGKLVLIGQYRHPHGKTHWELPAGRLNEGEDPAAGARRELLEETGHEAGTLRPLPGFYPTNGISAHYAHAYLATGCEEVGELNLDPAERIIPRCFTPLEVEAHLDAGGFEDGFTALTLMYWLRLAR